jgi:hypothetical protein
MGKTAVIVTKGVILENQSTSNWPQRKNTHSVAYSSEKINTLLRNIIVLLLAVSGCFNLAKLITVTAFKSTKLYFSSDKASEESTRMYLFIHLQFSLWDFQQLRQ